ncbi:MAG: ubiquinol-cytochrome c reductase iron-sulfur subunit N-terminal domain-containing protein, partial [Pseudomonadota bacterium]
MSDSQATHPEAIDEERRDFIHIATIATTAVGAGLVGYVFVDQ